MNINDLTYGEIKEILKSFGSEISEKVEDKEINHGVCINLLSSGFIYIGELITDNKFYTIKNPINMRSYTSGKGLLWHVKHGSEDTTLDGKDCAPYLKGPYDKILHWIPTKSKLWY